MKKFFRKILIIFVLAIGMIAIKSNITFGASPISDETVYFNNKTFVGVSGDSVNKSDLINISRKDIFDSSKVFYCTAKGLPLGYAPCNYTVGWFLEINPNGCRIARGTGPQGLSIGEISWSEMDNEYGQVAILRYFYYILTQGDYDKGYDGNVGRCKAELSLGKD